jgi:hypothetical protein
MGGAKAERVPTRWANAAAAFAIRPLIEGVTMPRRDETLRIQAPFMVTADRGQSLQTFNSVAVQFVVKVSAKPRGFFRARG